MSCSYRAYRPKKCIKNAEEIIIFRRPGRVNDYIIDLGLDFKLIKLLHILGYHQGH